jgi:hypothetical protein
MAATPTSPGFSTRARSTSARASTRTARNGRSPTGPKFIRSSTRPYPFDEDPVDGLTVEDVDGDGRILYMRMPDPNGNYKAHPDDPRLMVARDPAEHGGTVLAADARGERCAPSTASRSA